MQQLVFDLVAPEPPTFANFVPGRNAEALGALARFAAGGGEETGLLVWGEPGAGKTHLLRAAVAEATMRGRPAAYVGDPGALGAMDPDALARQALVAVDAIDSAGPDAQAKAFTLYNTLRASRGSLLAASGVPPAYLTLREDLRTRLGWGLVYEVVPLTDAEKPAALEGYARQRGMRLGEGVVEYLLLHGRRDMAWLTASLAALDRHSLAAKRPLTVPLLRQWLQRQLWRED
jgi:DnaA family protein